MRTSVQWEGPVVERPIEDVFAFVGNLENSPKWGRTRKTVRDPNTPDGAGARFLEESRILGQKVKHRSEVTRLDPPRALAYTSRFENGVSERTRITLATVEGGTRLDLAAEVEIEQIPQVLAPLVDLVIKQRMGALAHKLEQTFGPPDQSVMGAATMIAIGAILLATAGLQYLTGVFPEGAWSKILALLATALISASLAGILWRAAREPSTEQTSEPVFTEGGPAEE